MTESHPGLTYTCEACGGTFEAEWTDEEAQAEARELFPGVDPQDSSVVCDVCWREMLRLEEELNAVADE